VADKPALQLLALDENEVSEAGVEAVREVGGGGAAGEQQPRRQRGSLTCPGLCCYLCPAGRQAVPPSARLLLRLSARG
jgi:hypothetical protein